MISFDVANVPVQVDISFFFKILIATKMLPVKFKCEKL